MRDGDTIIALSSGTVPSGVAVIRISGSQAGASVQALCGVMPRPRYLTLCDLKLEGELVDRGLVAWFPAPGSFTGEDCAELQVHGSPAVVRRLLRGLTAMGDTRMAEAGEFTRRAFENGKLDLPEVEGLGDLILAETESQRKQAVARLAGGVSQRVMVWREHLLEARAQIEARLDFSDEGDVDATIPSTVRDAISTLRTEIGAAIESVGRGRVVREGLRVALAGAPNAGKSSLLNALARAEIAIVTEEAGTTRDVREVALDIGGQLVILVDMAGLREAASKAEAEGVRRAQLEIENADLVLWLTAPDVADVEMPATIAPVWRVASKLDVAAGVGDLGVSAVSGAGIQRLIEKIGAFAQELGGGEPVLLSRERDHAALMAAGLALERFESNVAALELAAEALRGATHALERLLGRVDAEMVLDRLFSRFCIGK